MASGKAKRPVTIIEIPSAFTISSNSAEQTVDLAAYKDCYFEDVYINNMATSLRQSPYVTEVNFNKANGELFFKRTGSGIYAGAVATVIFLRP